MNYYKKCKLSEMSALKFVLFYLMHSQRNARSPIEQNANCVILKQGAPPHHFTFFLKRSLIVVSSGTHWTLMSKAWCVALSYSNHQSVLPEPPNFTHKSFPFTETWLCFLAYVQQILSKTLRRIR